MRGVRNEGRIWKEGPERGRRRVVWRMIRKHFLFTPGVDKVRRDHEEDDEVL